MRESYIEFLEDRVYNYILLLEYFSIPHVSYSKEKLKRMDAQELRLLRNHYETLLWPVGPRQRD
jgi:hypothetical protein